MTVRQQHNRLLAGLLVIVMAVAIAACGDNSQTPTEQPRSPVPTQPGSPQQPPSPLATRTGG